MSVTTLAGWVIAICEGIVTAISTSGDVGSKTAAEQGSTIYRAKFAETVAELAEVAVRIVE